MEWLRPGETFPTIWQASIPLDVNVYYPQVVVQNANTLAVIATVDLVSSGGQLYTGKFQVPGDSSGLGFFISTTLHVWTDADHTTLSSDYEIENVVYLVQERPNRALFGGGGGSAFGLRDIRKIMAEEIATLQYLKLEEAKELVTEIVAQEIAKIPKVKFPKQEKYAELERIAVLESAIESIAKSLSITSEQMMGKFDEVHGRFNNHAGAIAEMDNKYSDVILKHGEMTGLVQKYASEMQEYVTKETENHKKEVKQQLRDIFSNVQIMQVHNGIQGLEGTEKPAQKDYLSIARNLV